MRKKLIDRSAYRVFQPRCRRAEFVKARERGVKVRLVEYLAAVDHVALYRHKVDAAPFGDKALRRGPIRRVSVDRSEVAEPMHNLGVGPDMLTGVPPGTKVCDQLTGRER